MKARWNSFNQRRTSHFFGVMVDDPEDPLYNLRFADDIVLVVRSRADVRRRSMNSNKKSSVAHGYLQQRL